MSFNFLFGDSIANPLLKHVLKINVRHSADSLDPDKNGASAGGATPQSVYNAMVKWKNSSYYTPMKDSVVVLSTGWSNAGAYYKKGTTSFETYGEWNYIEKQFQFLKNEGAKVFVIGIYSPPSSDDKYFSDGCTVVDASWFVNKGESKTSDVVKKRIFDEYQKANKWLFDKCNNYGFVFEQHSGGNTPLSNNNKGGYYYNGMSGDLHPSFVSHWNSMKQYVPEMTAEWTEWNKTGKKEVVKKEEGPTGSKWDLIFGDSIAAGIAKSALGLNRKAGGSKDPVSKDDKGASKVGANPDMILKYLKEFGEKNFDGKIVILSTGYSNGAHMKDIMKAQIKFLKDANASVEIIGVSNTKEGGNDFLSNLASENGFKFSGGFEPSEDGTHPKNYVDLWNTSVSKNLPVAPTKVPEEQKTEEEKKVEKVPEKKSIFPILVSGSYKANSETELIGFQSYTSTDGSITKLGGMDDIVMAKLAEIYLMGYNPIPTKVDVTVDSDDTQPTGGTVNWTVEINESMVEKDKGNGKAWVGFTSRGVSGQKTDKDAKALFLTRTDLQATAVKTNLLAMDQLKPEGDNYVNYKDTKIEVEIVKDVLYENPANIKNNIKNAFRQTFYRYTLEDGWPSADKNADKKPTDEEKKATDNATEQQTSGNLSLTISRPTRKWQIPLEFETGHPANRDIPTFHIFIGDETNLEGMDEMTDLDYVDDYDDLDPEYKEAEADIQEMEDGTILATIGSEVYFISGAYEAEVSNSTPSESVGTDVPSNIGDPGNIDVNRYNGAGYDVIKNIIFSGESGSYDSMYPSTTYKKRFGAECMTKTCAVVAKTATGAVGRYQSMPGYIINRAQSVGLDPNTALYNKNNQEKMGEMMINNWVGKYIKGENKGTKQNLIDAVQGLGHGWASLPVVIAGVKVGKRWVDGPVVGDVETGAGSQGYYNNAANRGGKIKDKKVADVVIALIKTRKNLAPKSFGKDFYKPSYTGSIV